MDMGLEGKSVLITGGSKGIGLACAMGFAAEGCSEIHLTSRTAEDLEAARAAVTGAYEAEVHVYPLDLSRPESVEQLLAACGDVDILVNNAGAIPGGSIELITDEIWR
jgi:NAD(P)-dependent dehydrogenase (short-subunit alcohol dehydrogenase family)